MDNHVVCSDEAVRIMNWIRNRGGIAIWDSANLADPGKTWTCPLNNEDGTAMGKQHWEMGKIIRVINDPNQVDVVNPKEIKRFHVALRRGSQGLSIKLTDASSKRLRKMLTKYGEESWYEFDYGTQEAVIYVPDGKKPLAEFVKGV
jgi:hypothetical protein